VGKGLDWMTVAMFICAAATAAIVVYVALRGL